MIRTAFIALAFASALAAAPLPKGGRKLCIALTPSSADTGLSQPLQTVRDAGADGPGDINLDWGAVEQEPGVFTDPDGILAWAARELPSCPVHLTLAPIQTTYTTVPPDLEGRPWNDSLVIARFRAFMDYVAGVLQPVTVYTVAIGNEVDVVLGTDQTAWSAYLTFFDSTSTYARTLWPGVQVGVKLTYDAARRPVSEPLILQSDATLLTYYPGSLQLQEMADSVLHDFRNMVDIAQGKPLHLVELGYPSSGYLQSSEAHQSAFVEAAFAAWDSCADAMPSLCYVWLHDLSAEILNVLMDGYGITDTSFREFLGTIGLKHADGRAKPAWTQLGQEAAARGWGTAVGIETKNDAIKPQDPYTGAFDLYGRPGTDIKGVYVILNPNGTLEKRIRF